MTSPATPSLTPPTGTFPLFFLINTVASRFLDKCPLLISQRSRDQLTLILQNPASAALREYLHVSCSVLLPNQKYAATIDFNLNLDFSIATIVTDADNNDWMCVTPQITINISNQGQSSPADTRALAKAALLAADFVDSLIEELPPTYSVLSVSGSQKAANAKYVKQKEALQSLIVATSAQRKGMRTKGPTSYFTLNVPGDSADALPTSFLADGRTYTITASDPLPSNPAFKQIVIRRVV